jgi:hypothetical protein
MRKTTRDHYQYKIMISGERIKAKFKRKPQKNLLQKLSNPKKKLLKRKGSKFKKVLTLKK